MVTIKKWEDFIKTWYRQSKIEFSKLLMHSINSWSFRLTSTWIISMMRMVLLILWMQSAKMTKSQKLKKSVLSLVATRSHLRNSFDWNFSLSMNWSSINLLINPQLTRSKQKLQRSWIRNASELMIQKLRLWHRTRSIDFDN